MCDSELLTLAYHLRKSTKVEAITATYPLGRPLSLMSGTKEVGVLEGCVSGADVDTPERMVLEVCEATDTTPGLALPFAESEVIACASELTLPDCDWDVEPRGL